VICDNLSAHKTRTVRAWLEAHENVTIHYTPTYSSWLNQVEIWFTKIQRDLIDCGIFTSTSDLRRKIMSYIQLHNRECRPFRWTYGNTRRGIRVNEKPLTAHSLIPVNRGVSALPYRAHNLDTTLLRETSCDTN
jgi:hypothetical protein